VSSHSQRSRFAVKGQSFAASVALALVIGVLAVLWWTGTDLERAARAMVTGAIGSQYAILSSTLVRATPLILAGLAVSIAFKGGIFNIGAEGQLLAGAAAACAIALTFGTAPRWVVIPLALLGGGVAGALLAGAAAWLRVRFQVLEVISTILLNLVMLNVVGYLVRGPLQEPTHIYPQSATLTAAAQLPALIGGTRLHIGFLLALVSCVFAWWWIRNTAGGFRLRAVGANPHAAQSAGQIDLRQVIIRTFLVSGACAGLAGAIELTGVTLALYEDLSPGYGFTAIAVALLANLNPLGVIVTGVCFGALETGAAAMQRDAGVPSVIVAMIEATIILIVVAARQGAIIQLLRDRVSAAPSGGIARGEA
jgi:ABC-type uncharacterized transport system permease subunit